MTRGVDERLVSGRGCSSRANAGAAQQKAEADDDTGDMPGY
jgi:hypothetical protein